MEDWLNKMQHESKNNKQDARSPTMVTARVRENVHPVMQSWSEILSVFAMVSIAGPCWEQLDHSRAANSRQVKYLVSRHLRRTEQGGDGRRSQEAVEWTRHSGGSKHAFSHVTTRPTNLAGMDMHASFNANKLLAVALLDIVIPSTTAMLAVDACERPSTTANSS